MALKILQGGLKNPTSQELVTQEGAPEQERSWASSIFGAPVRAASRLDELLEGGIGSLGQLGLGLANKGIGVLTGNQNALPQQISLPEFDLLGALQGKPLIENKPLPTMQSIQERNEKFVEPVLGKEALRSKGSFEKVVDSVLSDIPLALFTGGGSVGGKLLTSLGSNLASEAAHKAGAGPLGEIGAGLLGGSLTNLIRRGGGPGTLRKNAKKIMTDYYNKAEEIVPKIKSHNGTELESFLNKELNKLNSGKSGLDSTMQKEVIKQLNKVQNNITLSKIKVADAWETKKHLNSLIKKATDPDLKNYYKRTVGAINENILQPAAKSNPEFGKYFNTAEDLYRGINAPSAIRKVIEDATDLQKIIKNPLAQLGLLGGSASILTGKVGLPGAGLAIATPLATRYIARTVDFFTKSKTARLLFKDIAEKAINDEKAALPSLLTKLDSEADKYDKENPIEESQSKIKILKGGRKSS